MSNDINSTTLTYQGVVDISYMINGREVKFRGHNEGLRAMFKFISKILAGDLSTAANDAPTYLDIKCEWSDGVEQKKPSVLYSPLSISDPTYFFDSKLGWVSRFKIVLSYNMINFDFIETQVPNEAETYFYLVAGDGKTEFARLQLKEDDIKLTDIVPGTQGLIQWTLIFENKSTTGA